MRVLRLGWVLLQASLLAANAGTQDQPTEADATRAVEDGRFEAALSVYEDLSRIHPENVDYRVWAARISRWLGDNEGAVARLDEILGTEPDSVEAGVEKAYARMAQQRFPEAAALLAPIAAREDDNADVLMAMARLYRYQGDDARASEYVQLVLETQPDHPEALEMEDAIAASPAGDPSTSMTIGYGHGRFSFAEPAHTTELTISYLGERTRLDLGAETWDKFGNRSQRLGPAVSHRIGRNLWLRASATWARHAQVLPRQSFAAGASWTLAGGWVASGDYRQLRFEDPLVHVVSPSVEYYFDGPMWIRLAFYRSWAHFRTSTTPDAEDNALSVQYNQQLGSAVAGFVGYAHGNESYSNLSIDRLSTVGANTFSAGATIRLSGALFARWSYGLRASSDGARENSFGVGLTVLR